jgi:hypothetical protein
MDDIAGIESPAKSDMTQTTVSISRRENPER